MKFEQIEILSHNSDLKLFPEENDASFEYVCISYPEYTCRSNCKYI